MAGKTDKKDMKENKNSPLSVSNLTQLQDKKGGGKDKESSHDQLLCIVFSCSGRSSSSLGHNAPVDRLDRGVSPRSDRLGPVCSDSMDHSQDALHYWSAVAGAPDDALIGGEFRSVRLAERGFNWDKFSYWLLIPAVFIYGWVLFECLVAR